MEPTTPERASSGAEGDETATKREVDADEVGSLSVREIEILQLLADGCSNRDVSERLVVSVETVKTHVKHILSKLGARHRAEAVAIALRRKMID